MSDHQDRTRTLPDSGRLQHVTRSDLEHAAREVLKQCETIEAPSNCMRLAVDNLRKVLGC